MSEPLRLSKLAYTLGDFDMVRRARVEVYINATANSEYVCVYVCVYVWKYVCIYGCMYVCIVRYCNVM